MTDTVTYQRPDTEQFYLPTKPYSFIDAINRRAAATGSVGYAMAAASADYNGHFLTVSWNSFRGYYVGEYHWGERVVVVRNTKIAEVLRVAKEWYKQSGRGARVSFHVKPEDAEVLRADPDVKPGDIKEEPLDWQDWRFPLLTNVLDDEKRYGIPVKIILDATSKEDYEARRRSMLEERSSVRFGKSS